MKSISRIVTLVGAVMFSSLTFANTCVQSDAAGTWHVYILTVQSAGYYWARCKATLDQDGNINISSSNCKVPKITTSFNATGKLTLDNTCRVTGHVYINGADSYITEAWLNNEKDVIAGVGTIYGYNFSLNGIKQP